ncbi:MAG: cysteine hydrolase, partial [Firmicutes bacterium]|nr:cysteine hydrolase [Bacillota bacterium]
PIVIDASACAAPDPAMHKAALQVLAGLQIEIINK